jgi:hypothetical protein
VATFAPLFVRTVRWDKRNSILIPIQPSVYFTFIFITHAMESNIWPCLVCVTLHNTYLSYVRLETRESPIAKPDVLKIIASVNAMDKTQTSRCFSGLKFWGKNI